MREISIWHTISRSKIVDSMHSGGKLKLRAGDWVEVRSKAEILATLDDRGRLDGLPFMPEMLQFCGRRFQVWKRAHKTCDTVNRTGGRRMRSAVHLRELRCDGEAHGGCGAGCLLFWKEAWLRRVTVHEAHSSAPEADQAGGAALDCRCTEERLVAETRTEQPSHGGEVTYSCQATSLPTATTPLKWWDPRQYLEDLTSGNVRLGTLAAGAMFVLFHGLVRRTTRHPSISSRLLRFYDWLQRRRAGTPYPRRHGTVAAGSPTPSRPLHLQPGEWVRVRPYEEILATLDARNKNRGLYFDAEEVPFCGKTFRVRSNVQRLIDERTGRMLKMQDHSVILENVWCQARYSDRRMFCPRAIYSIWRETWLDRAPEPNSRADPVPRGSSPD